MQLFFIDTQRKGMVIRGYSQYNKTNYVFPLKKGIKRLLRAMGQSIKLQFITEQSRLGSHIAGLSLKE